MSTVTAVAYKNSEMRYFGGALQAQLEHSGITISEVSYSTTRKCPKHSHERAFFALLLNGGYAETLCKRTLEQPRFSVTFRPAEVTHSDEIMTSDGLFFLVELSDAWLQRLEDCSPISEPALCDSQVSWLALRLHQHFQNKTLCSLMTEGIVLEMLAGLLPRSQTTESCTPEWLPVIEDRLRSEFAKKHTLTEIALDLGLDPAYLSQTFRKFTGQSVGEYLQCQRVKYALSKLGDPQLTLSEIALLAGFSDQSQFTRIFKQRTGLTPGTFRSTAPKLPKSGDRRIRPIQEA